MDRQKITVHPLVVMTVPDHYTRALYRQSKDAKHKTKVVGLLLGMLSNIEQEVCVPIEVYDNDGVVDVQYINKRIDMYKQIPMFKEYEVIGWYQGIKGAADKPTKEDHKFATNVMSQFISGQSQLMFQFNLTSQTAADNQVLPLFAYEVRQDDFYLLDYKLSSSNEAEKIAVEDIYQAFDARNNMSIVNANMKAPLNAIKLLRSKLNFLIKAVESSAEVRANHDFMRRLNQIMCQTPIASKQYYDQQVVGAYSEVQLLSMMSEIMHSQTQIESLITTFNSYKNTMNSTDDAMMGADNMMGGRSKGSGFGGQVQNMMGKMRGFF